MSLNKTIIIVGAGRSGSTVFHKMMARHPRLAWLSRLCDRYPRKPLINHLLMKALDAPLIGPYLQTKSYPEECYIFWDHYCKGFSVPRRDLTASDISTKAKSKVLAAMKQMVTPKRDRLLIKITGWPRIGYLKEIFPNAKYIHVYRDGRAVANSYLNMEWWKGWEGPDNWRWGPLTEAQNEIWIKHDKSYVALACMEWQILMHAMDKAKSQLNPDDFTEVRYETLCSDPTGEFKRVLEFCDLESSEEFNRFISGFPLKNINDKWETELNSEQKRIMTSVLKDDLKKYGYQ